jgi:hypothetical protein
MYQWTDMGPVYETLADSGRTSRRATLHLDFPTLDIAFVDASGHRVPIRQIQMTGTFSVELNEVPLTGLYRYRQNSVSLLSEGTEAEVEINGAPVTLSMQRFENSGGTFTFKAVAFTRDGRPLPSFDFNCVIDVGDEVMEMRGSHESDGVDAEQT